MVSKAKIDRLVEAREHEEGKLYRADGTKLYSEDEHAERMSDIGRRFRSAMDEMDAEIEAKVAAAEESVLVAENAAPTDALTTEELAAANARRPFVSDEVYTLPIDKLIARCKAILSVGDRPAAFLYSMYGAQRAEMAGDENGIYELREVVAELRRKANPDGEKRIETARKALQEAGGLKDYAYMRRRGAKDALGLYLQQRGYVAAR